MITACYLAIFLQFVSMEVVCHEAAVLDSVIVGPMLGAVLHLMYIETDGVDAVGNELHTVQSRTVCCNCLPVIQKTLVGPTRRRSRNRDSPACCDSRGRDCRLEYLSESPHEEAAQPGEDRARARARAGGVRACGRLPRQGREL